MYVELEVLLWRITVRLFLFRMQLNYFGIIQFVFAARPQIYERERYQARDFFNCRWSPRGSSCGEILFYLHISLRVRLMLPY